MGLGSDAPNVKGPKNENPHRGQESMNDEESLTATGGDSQLGTSLNVRFVCCVAVTGSRVDENITGVRAGRHDGMKQFEYNRTKFIS